MKQALLALVFSLSLVSGCRKPAAAVLHSSKGVIIAFKAENKAVVIRHEAFPDGFMEAMIMPFEVADPKLLEGFKVGDTVEFSLQATDTGFPLVAIKKMGK